MFSFSPFLNQKLFINYHLKQPSNREAEYLRFVTVRFHHRHSKFKPHRHRPEPLRQKYLNTRADRYAIAAGIDRAGIHKEQSLEHIAGKRNGHFAAGKENPVAADGVFFFAAFISSFCARERRIAARAYAAIFKAANTLRAARIEFFKRRRIADDLAEMQLCAQDGFSLGQIFVNRFIPSMRAGDNAENISNR